MCSSDLNYEVSNYGRVRKVNGIGFLSINLGSFKFPRVTLCKNGIRKCFQINTLVAKHFLDPAEDGMRADNIDGDIYNNHVLNLRWIKDTGNRNNGRESKGSITEKKLLTGGTSYRVQFRKNAKKTNATFRTREDAEAFLEKLKLEDTPKIEHEFIDPESSDSKYLIPLDIHRDYGVQHIPGVKFIEYSPNPTKNQKYEIIIEYQAASDQVWR